MRGSSEGALRSAPSAGRRSRKAREIDVIDVNRIWSVFVGSRRHGYGLGTVKAADRNLAMQAARLKWPGTRIGFVQEF